MDKKQLDELKTKLPKGWCSIIAGQLGVTSATISNAMNGKFRNTKAIEAAIQLARDTTLATQKNLADILDKLK